MRTLKTGNTLTLFQRRRACSENRTLDSSVATFLSVRHNVSTTSAETERAPFLAAVTAKESACQTDGRMETGLTPKSRRSNQTLYDQHRVAIAVKPILLLDRFPVGLECQFTTGKGTDEHE